MLGLMRTMKKLSIMIILASFLSQFISCNNKEITRQDTIYVAGVEAADNGKTIATYWVNNRKFSLTNGTYSSNAASIFVLNQDVYIAGYEYNFEGNPIAKYWKNGIETILSNNWSLATSITISGLDVYVAGYERIGDGTKTIAKCWKNAIAFDLTDGTSYDFTSSIKVINNDVYITGGQNNGNLIAKYWKNGDPVILSAETSTSAYANSIDVVGNDIYIAGKEANSSLIPIAKYWKNGTSINLTTGDNYASANSITISNGDVYVAGYESNSDGTNAVKYWKNGMGINLPSTSLTDLATSIKVIFGNIYVTGEEGAYWKNGVQTKLSTDSKVFSARDIFIVSK
jgi:hypothetical protein